MLLVLNTMLYRLHQGCAETILDKHTEHASRMSGLLVQMVDTYFLLIQ
jgi:hypothetical protein